MFKAPRNRFLVPFDRKFKIKHAPAQPGKSAPGKKKNQERLKTLLAEFTEQQRALYAADSWALLLIFQALDAAGKDGTIRAVTAGLNPAGCQVYSFKRPSDEELDHDFLWRTACRLPERGRIGIFNRSYYEEVLIARVHPEILRGQKLPVKKIDHAFWERRFASIRDHERHLAANGTLILKFWLNVSLQEQNKRFLERIDAPEKNWKFEAGDVRERDFRDDYLRAYQDALNATSRPWAPWYAIPADDKPFMRACVAEVIVGALRSLQLQYPRVSAEKRAELQKMRALLKDSVD